MIPELDPEDFVAFLAATWDERGWETSVRERSDETHFVVGKRPDGKRGVIYTFPTTTATVTERHLKKFVSFCEQKGIDVAVVATQGSFAEAAEAVADRRSVHLLDRSSLADTVEEGGLEDVLARFTDGGGGITGRLRGLGVPVPASVTSWIPGPRSLLASVVAAVPIGGTADDAAASDGGTSPADAPAPSSSAPDGLGIVAGLYRSCRRPVPAGLLAVVLAVAFVLGAVAGSAAGLGGMLGGSAAGGDGPDVSAVSTAGEPNATVEVRWNARAADSITANGTTYDAPEGQTFLLVRMNVTNGGGDPAKLERSALAVDVAGTRYGRQPLDGATGFPTAVLLAPDESREVWTAFAIPDGAGSATIVVDGESQVRFVRDDGVSPEASVE